MEKNWNLFVAPLRKSMEFLCFHSYSGTYRWHASMVYCSIFEVVFSRVFATKVWSCPFSPSNGRCYTRNTLKECIVQTAEAAAAPNLRCDRLVDVALYIIAGLNCLRINFVSPHNTRLEWGFLCNFVCMKISQTRTECRLLHPKFHIGWKLHNWGFAVFWAV